MNMQYLLIHCAFLAVISLSSNEPVSHPVDDYYTAAVVEHARLGSVSDPPEEVLRRNLNVYETAAAVAATKGADIIIFPEYGLYAPPEERTRVRAFLEHTPDPQEISSNPCEQEDEFSDRPVLYALSCMAKKHRMVLVANTGDIQPCIQQDSNCPDDGVKHYNTLVAFNRNGTLISRYHKAHLFYELFMDLPEGPQDPVFETDFGTFAMFICFDYIFEGIVKAAERVDNIILSSLWLNRMPLSNSVPYYQGWALVNNVTYLASNINIPGFGAVGSGIFSGHFGPIKYTNNPDGRSKVVVSRVPKSKYQEHPLPNPDSSITVVTEDGTEEYDEDTGNFPSVCDYDVLGGAQDLMKDYRCLLTESLANYTLTKLTKMSDDLEACNDGMCCSLKYSASSMDETYFFGVLNGTHNLTNRYSWCEENCIVVRCDAFNGSECATFPVKSNTIFNRIEIKANFTTEYVYPSVVQSSIKLAPMNQWSHSVRKVTGGQIIGYLQYESDLSDPLLVAGLNGRCYERDPPYER